MPTTTQPDPLTILRTAAAVIQVRGRYQPASRQGEPEPPTIFVVRDYLEGFDVRSRFGIPRTHIDRAYAEHADTAAAIHQWGQHPEGDEFRAKLAAILSRPAVTEQDLPMLCYAPQAYQRERDRADRAAQREQEAANSRHQGTLTQRLTAEVTVTYVKTLTSTYFGYTEQPRNLMTLRDDAHNVYVWEAKTHNIPARGTRVRLTGTVSAHETYRHRATGHETAQTRLIRCRWTLTTPA